MYPTLTTFKSNVYSFMDAEYPLTVHILRSGDPDRYIVVLEDSTDLDTKLLSIEEIETQYGITLADIN